MNNKAKLYEFVVYFRENKVPPSAINNLINKKHVEIGSLSITQEQNEWKEHKMS